MKRTETDTLTAIAHLQKRLLMTGGHLKAQRIQEEIQREAEAAAADPLSGWRSAASVIESAKGVTV